MKKLIMSTIIVISSLTAFSQKDTTIPTKSFPIPVVKLIVKDLLSGDSAKAQLELVNKELEKTRQIVVLKDSVISNLNTKIEYDGYILGLEKDKFKLLENHNGKVEKQLKIEKIKSRLFGSLTTIGLLVIGAFIITK